MFLKPLKLQMPAAQSNVVCESKHIDLKGRVSAKERSM